jgi:hypothetical protein
LLIILLQDNGTGFAAGGAASCAAGNAVSCSTQRVLRPLRNLLYISTQDPVCYISLTFRVVRFLRPQGSGTSCAVCKVFFCAEIVDFPAANRAASRALSCAAILSRGIRATSRRAFAKSLSYICVFFFELYLCLSSRSEHRTFRSTACRWLHSGLFLDYLSVLSNSTTFPSASKTEPAQTHLLVKLAAWRVAIRKRRFFRPTAPLWRTRRPKP